MGFAQSSSSLLLAPIAPLISWKPKDIFDPRRQTGHSIAGSTSPSPDSLGAEVCATSQPQQELSTFILLNKEHATAVKSHW